MVKPMFNGQEDVLMQTPQATGLGDLNNPDIGPEDSVHYVPMEEMRSEVFEPDISDVLDLIQKQLHQCQVSIAIFMALDERVWQESSHLVGLIAPLSVPNWRWYVEQCTLA
ncbi:MAG: hypothetical protein J3Q66DRAFT_340504 [Benniella sp.]|nr:MAG: hypothetical protein J3Q66DRAFT_340504 [Benniella sp.]